MIDQRANGGRVTEDKAVEWTGSAHRGTLQGSSDVNTRGRQFRFTFAHTFTKINNASANIHV